MKRSWFAATVIAALFMFNATGSVAVADELPVAKLPADDVVVTEHRARINGERFEYRATTGTQPVFNAEGEATAALHFTYYERMDVKSKAERPLLISFNGGPGSASVWMHIAYTGPKSLRVDDEGFPIMPYGVKDNPHSVLDVADIVFVNPVNTGYSRVLPNSKGEMPSREKQKDMFFGVNADVKYLADWINTFVTRHNRWQSPKYLIGESYGTTRVSGLALELQNRQWMYFNGVILVSPTDLGIDRSGPVKAANRLPYFAAAAWYHKALDEEFLNMDLLEFLPMVEKYTLDTYLPALAKGSMLPAAEREQVAAQVAKYSGIDKNVVLQTNLDIDTWFFWKELLRDRGQTIGRLDSRYLGIDRTDVGARPDYNAELTSWLHSFTPAINYYMREVLNYETDVKYNMFGPVHPWDRSGNETGHQLGEAMRANPYLHVLTQSGYYDGATNYFDGKYNMWHIDPSGKMADRFEFKGYRSGHMMYLRSEDLRKANEDLREFILRTIPAQGEAAKYPPQQ